MEKYIRILLFLFVPLLLAAGIVELANRKYDTGLRQTVSAMAAEQGEQADFSSLTGWQLCRIAYAETGEAPEEFCRDITWMFWAKIVAGLMLLGSGLYVLLVGWLGRCCRGNRKRLLFFFRPVIYLTALLAGLVLLANILVWLVALFYIQAAYWDRVFVKLLALVAVGGLIGLYLLVQALWYALKAPVLNVTDFPLPESTYPKLWELVRQVAHKLKARMPEHIVAGMDVSFYATEVKHVTPLGPLEGEILHISLPLCRVLTQQELEFVIGHELSHFAGDDVKYSTRFYPIYTGASRALLSLREQSQQNLPYLLALYPAVQLFSFFMAVFSEAEAEISRLRELRADHMAQEYVCTALQAASALVKVHAYAPLFQEVLSYQEEGFQEDKILLNLCSIYRDIAEQCPREVLIQNMEMDNDTHPTDSHPSLGERLASLGVSRTEAETAGLQLPQQTASSVIERLEDTEKELSDISNYVAYQRYLASLKPVS